MKNERPVACPFGVNNSTINTAVLGTTTGVPNVTVNNELARLGTDAACVPTNVRVPPGNVPVVCVYNLTVTGCAPPVACSTPNVTVLTVKADG